jgi:hypothetical protein
LKILPVSLDTRNLCFDGTGTCYFFIVLTLTVNTEHRYYSILWNNWDRFQLIPDRMKGQGLVAVEPADEFADEILQ